MYLNTWLDWTGIDITQYARENSTYSAFYFYWRDELFSRVMRLFKEQTDPIPTKEIEIRLMMQGHVGIAPLKYSGKNEHCKTLCRQSIVKIVCYKNSGEACKNT